MPPIFGKSKHTAPKVVHIDPRTFRELKNSISDQPRKAKYIFIRPKKDGRIDIYTYYESPNALEKLKHLGDAKTTTKYLKSAAEKQLDGTDKRALKAAHFILSKKNNNLAKVTAASEEAIRVLAEKERDAEQQRRVKNRSKKVKSSKTRGARLELLQSNPKHRKAQKDAASRPAVPPLKLNAAKQAVDESYETVRDVISELEQELARDE